MWSRILVDLDSTSIRWSFLHLFESECVVVKSRPTLCDPMDCSLPGSSVHGILQARILEWVAISFSRGSSRTQGSNSGLLHCGQSVYHLSHQGIPFFICLYTVLISRSLCACQPGKKRGWGSNPSSAAAKSLQSWPTLVRPHRWQPTRLPRSWDSPGKNTGVGCRFLLQCMKVKSESEVALSCLTLSDRMDCTLPGSSVHGICQARTLEWGAIAFSTSSTTP